MTKKSTQPRKSVKKRGPKEERLVITGDPAAALARLLASKPKAAK
jgi:hypothetical protein